MLLPPTPTPFSDSQVEVQMKFMTAGTTIQIEPSVVFVPTANERSLVVGWCDASTAAGQPASDTVQNLLFERFAPSSDNVYQRILMTSVVRVAPEDLPAQPLAYTSFDVVVLTAEAFKEVSERQLQALARWARGGGSVCVFVAGGLQPHHIWFLNQLAESTPVGSTFRSDDAGNLLPAQKDILYLRSGLGRSVVVTGENAAALSLNPPTWRKAASFLWKMRGTQVQALTDLGHWEVPASSSMESNSVVRARQFSRNRLQFAAPFSYSVQPTSLGAELMNQLMPKTVRLIPFSALIGMLVLFVLLIGPVDYFVLGFLRRRRLTWVLFPTTSIAFTIATVLMANHYLGLRDQRRSLIVVDLAKDGTALRWNRYELVFAARDRQSVTELKDALWAPLDIQTMQGQYYSAYNPNNRSYGYRGGEVSQAEPPLYVGTLPVHFQTSEAIRQWRPELNRIFSFESPPVRSLPNWRSVEEAWPNLGKIRATLSAKKPFVGDLCAISSTNASTFDSGSRGILPVEILEEICRGDRQGLFSVVSQISPTGGGNFEDVPAMDTETRDSALAIVTQSGDDIVVYRRFFYGN
jgi:hypothetical protein